MMKTIDADEFNCSTSERASFEAGIKLGSLYHQFIGVPVGSASRKGLETTMREAMMMQPHVLDAGVIIDREILKAISEKMGYCSLNERMIKAWVLVEVEGVRCMARLEWNERMGYPLMWVERMTDPVEGDVS